MSDLRERLERLGVTRGMPATPKEPHPPPHGPGIEDVVAGEVVETPLGPCFVTEQRWPLDHAHGGISLRSIHAVSNGTLAALARDQSLHEIDMAATAFIDIETSGLAGGTGTYAFLVGVGLFDAGTFRVRQYFLRGPHEEPALIHLLDECFGGFDAVVSFNGKAFDLPLLQTRFTLQRRRFPLENTPHLDLLTPARRLWKERLPSCALTSLEERILGIFREGDVPGWLIPSRYFEYLQTGNAEPLQPVFTHNALDILSLVSLTAHMASIFAAPESAGVIHGADWYCLGRCYENLAWADRAAMAYQRVLTAPCAPAVRHLALRALSFLYKRQGSWDRAVQIWHDLVEAGISNHLYPYEELAKYYEHRRREYGIALKLVREAITRIECRELEPRRSRQRALAELRHRLHRLETKQRRHDH